MAGRDVQVEMGNGYSVRWDGSHNWVMELTRTAKRKEGGGEYERMEIIGYYSTLAAARVSLDRKMIGESGAQTAGDLLVAIVKAEQAITAAVQRTTAVPS